MNTGVGRADNPVMPSVDCASFVTPLSNSALATGDAAARMQAFSSWLEQNPPREAIAGLQSELARATREQDAAKTAGTQLAGQAYAACPALPFAEIIQPGVALGQLEGGRAAYLKYATLVKDKTKSANARDNAEVEFPLRQQQALREQYEMKLQQIRTSVGVHVAAR